MNSVKVSTGPYTERCTIFLGIGKDLLVHVLEGAAFMAIRTSPHFFFFLLKEDKRYPLSKGRVCYIGRLVASSSERVAGLCRCMSGSSRSKLLRHESPSRCAAVRFPASLARFALMIGFHPSSTLIQLSMKGPVSQAVRVLGRFPFACPLIVH